MIIKNRLPVLGVSALVVAIFAATGSWYIKHTPIHISGMLDDNSLASISGSGSGIIGHWKFDETAGNVAADSASGKDAAFATPPEWSNGKVGGSVKLNGQEVPRVASSDTYAFESTDKFSAFAWYNSQSPTYSGIIGKTSCGYVGWTLGIYNAESFMLAMSDTSGKAIIAKFERPTSPGWHHVGFSYDGSKQYAGIKVYVDGHERAFTLDPNTGILGEGSMKAASDLWLGAAYCNQQYLNGSLDDVRIYNKVVPLSEVREIYELSGDAVPSDIVKPTVNLTAPANNATISGSSVTLSANATDNISVAKVVFKIDGSIISEDTGLPYDAAFNTLSYQFPNGSYVQNGTYNLVATAYDAAGNFTDSAPRTVQVSNTAAPGPDVTPPTPRNRTASSFTPGATQAVLKIATDESSVCKYSTTPNTAFSAMTSTFEGGGGINHAATVSGLTDGTTYTYYARCQDIAPAKNTNTSDTVISFLVRSPVVSGSAEVIDGSDLVDFPMSALWNRPINYTPGNGEDVTLNPPMFTWYYDPGPPTFVDDSTAKTFRLIVADNKSFSNPVINATTDWNLYAIAPVLNAGTYYWKVEYYHKGASQPYAESSVRSFKVSSSAPKWDRSKLADPAYVNSKIGRDVHPHILITNENRAQISAFLNRKLQEREATYPNPPYTQNSYDTLIAEAWKYMIGTADADILETWWDKPNAKTMKGFSARAKAIRNLGFVWQLTQDPKYKSVDVGFAMKQLAQDFIDGGYWKQDLIGSEFIEVVYGLAHGYDWFYSELDAAEADKVRDAVERYVSWVMYASYRDGGVTRTVTEADYNTWVSNPRAYAGNYIVNNNDILRHGGSHTFDSVHGAFRPALAIYGESEVAKRYNDFAINYMIARGTPFNYGNGVPNQGRIYGMGNTRSPLEANVLLGIAFPEIGLSKNPYIRGAADWWNRTHPVGFVANHDAFGDGGRRGPMFPHSTTADQQNYGRNVSLFLNDRNTWDHTFAEYYNYNTEGKYNPDDVGLILSALNPVPTAIEAKPLVRHFKEDGWVTGCSKNPDTDQCFMNGVGFTFVARPSGAAFHSGVGDLSYEMWAYGTTFTDSSSGYGRFLNSVSQGHYTVMVNGYGYGVHRSFPIQPYMARIFAYKVKPNYVYFAADGTNLYPTIPYSASEYSTDFTPDSWRAAHADAPLSFLKKAHRHFLFVKNKYFIVFDDLATDGTRSATFSSLFPVLENTVTWNDAGKTSFSYTSNVRNIFGVTPATPPVTVHVKQIFNPGNNSLKVDDMNGLKVYANPIPGREAFNFYDDRDTQPGERRAHTVWTSNSTPAESWNFLTVIYPENPNDASTLAPVIEKINDYTVKVTANDGSGDVDVISFNPAVAPADTTILVDINDLIPTNVDDDVTGRVISCGEACQPGPVTTNYTLTVRKIGTGAGIIVGSGINCDAGNTDCVESKPSGSNITITATPAQMSTFTGWEGDCSGVAPCSLSLTENKDVSAIFTFSGNGVDDDIVVNSISVDSLLMNQAEISWNTDRESNSQIEYGTSISYGNLTPVRTDYTTSHKQKIESLMPNTVYHYRVISRDINRNVTMSPDHTFTTPKYGDGVKVVTIKPIMTKGDVPVEVAKAGSTGYIVSNTKTILGKNKEGWLVVFDQSISDICNPAEKTTDESMCTGIHDWLRYSSQVFDWAGTAPVVDDSYIAKYAVTPPAVIGISGTGISSPGSRTMTTSVPAPTIPNPSPTPVSAVAAPAPIVNTTTTTAASAPTAVSSSITKSLKKGSTGSEVAALQAVLAKEKLLSAKYAKGTFDSATEIALKSFQQKYFIVISGTPETTGFGATGPKTRAKLNEILRNSKPSVPTVSASSQKITKPLSLGSKDSEVAILQSILVKEKFLTGSYAKGTLDAATESALKAFQRKNGIVSSGTPATTGYGSTGPVTRNMLNSIK